MERGVHATFPLWSSKRACGWGEESGVLPMFLYLEHCQLVPDLHGREWRSPVEINLPWKHETISDPWVSRYVHGYLRYRHYAMAKQILLIKRKLPQALLINIMKKMQIKFKSQFQMSDKDFFVIFTDASFMSWLCERIERVIKGTTVKTSMTNIS